jgi:surface protein
MTSDYLLNVGPEVTVLPEASNQVTATIPLSNGNQGTANAIAVDPTTHRVFATAPNCTLAVIDGTSDTVLSYIPTCGNAIAVDPTTGMVYVTSADGVVTVIDEASSSIIDTFSVGTDAQGIAIDPTTGTVFVADTGNWNHGGSDQGQIAVIDEATNTVTQYIPMADTNPTTVAVNPATGLVYVGNWNTPSVAVIGTSPSFGTGNLAFTATTYSAIAGQPATVTVQRTGDLSMQTTVNYATSDATAIAGTDYTPSSGTLTFPPGAATESFNVATAQHGAANATPSLNLALSSPVNGGLRNPATATVSLQESVPPALTADTPPSDPINQPYSYTFTATGSPAPTFSVSSGSLPSGLTLDAVSGVLSGTPTTSGPSTFTVTASNGSYLTSESAPITLTIDVAPVFTADTPPTTDVEGSGCFCYFYTFTASGIPAPVFTLASGTLPPGMYLDSFGNLGGTPIGPGTFTYQVQASNGTAPDALSPPLILTITGSPVVPSAPTIGPAVSGDGQANVSFTAPSYDGDSPIIDYTVTASPGGATASGSASPINVPGLTNGVPYTFTVTATNGVGTSYPSAASNAVTPDPLTAMAPVFSADTPSSAFQGGASSVIYTFVASGNPAPTFSLAPGAPSWLLIDPVTGNLTVAVNPYYGRTATYSVVATNSVSTTTVGPFTLSVDGPPDYALYAPPLTFTAGSTYEYSFAEGGVPLPSFALAAGAPSWLSIDPNTGLLTGDPPYGTSTFSYAVLVTSVFSGGPDTATTTTYTVSVSGAPTISGATITGTPSVGQTLSAVAGTLTGNPTPTPSYQWSTGASPINGATGPTYVPAAGDVGHTLTVTITETSAAGSAGATSAPTATVTTTGVSSAPMTMTINTSVAGCTGLTVQLPLGGGVNAAVNWGDGTAPQAATSSNPTHTYAIGGTYTISISGSVGAFGAESPFCQLTGVTSWGNNGTSGEVGLAGLTSLAYAFYASASLTAVPTTFPTAVTSTAGMFDGAHAFNQDISGWNTAAVTDMTEMFGGASAFNQNISNWNTAAVTSMNGMFDGDAAFNQDISSWNTAAVTNMNGMFSGASAFNQDISNWNTAAVTSTIAMFYNAIAFNQDISSWNTAAVTNMYMMFFNATAFNNGGSPLGNANGGWNTAAVTNMWQMFFGASAFNQDISSWNTAAVTNMSGMFYGATAFNQSLGTWVITGVTSMSSMFSSTPLSIANYDATLNGWAGQTVHSGVALGAANLTYDASGTLARNTLTGAPDSWTITGDLLSTASTTPTISGTTITGTPSVGQTLSAVAGTVTGSPTPTPTYQWSSGSAPITGATGSTYVVSAGDVGHTLTVTITETNTAGSAGATSAATATLTGAPQTDSINFSSTAPSNATVGGATYTAAASASSGLPVALTIDASATGVCSITSGGVVSFTGVGNCVIDANQAGDSNYEAATQVQQSVMVAKVSQSISFSSTAPASATVGGATYSPVASATSGLTVALTVDSSSSSVCAIASGVVSFTGVGTCVIDANRPADSNYTAATQVQQSFSVGQGSQTITFNAEGGSSVSSMSGPHGSTITLPGAPTLAGSTFDGWFAATSGGSSLNSPYTLAGSTTFYAQWIANATAQSPLTLTSTAGTAGTALTLTTSGGSGTGAVSYSVTSAGTTGCSITSGVLNATTAGTCTVTATKAADATYSAVSSAATTVTFAAASGGGGGGSSTTGPTNAPPPSSLSAPDYGTPVSGTASSTAITTVTQSSGGVSVAVTVPAGALPAGTTVSVYPITDTSTLTADVPAGQSYVLSFAVSWETPSDTSPAASTPITMTITDPSIKAGDTIYELTSTGLVAVGTATVDGSATVTFSSDPVFVVAEATLDSQAALTFTTLKGTVGKPLTLVTRGGSGAGAVTFTVTNGTAKSCVVSGSSLSAGTAGTCVVTATKAADSTYLVASSASTVSLALPARPTALTVTYHAKSYALSAAVKEALLALSKKLLSGASVTITGYANANKTLARDRAKEAANYLAARVSIHIKLVLVTRTTTTKTTVVTTKQ